MKRYVVALCASLTVACFLSGAYAQSRRNIGLPQPVHRAPSAQNLGRWTSTLPSQGYRFNRAQTTRPIRAKAWTARRLPAPYTQMYQGDISDLGYKQWDFHTQGQGPYRLDWGGYRSMINYDYYKWNPQLQ